MLKRFSPLTILPILLGVIAVAHAQADPQQPPTTQYDKFVKRTDVVIVTQSYPLPDLPGGGGYRLSAKVAWALGETKKVYAADFHGRLVDFDQLAGIQDGLGKMIRAVSTSFDSLNASSISYASASGISANYYSYVIDGSDKPKRNLYLVAGGYIYQSPNIEPLMQFRDLVVQTRDKLASLGAK